MNTRAKFLQSCFEGSLRAHEGIERSRLVNVKCVRACVRVWWVGSCVRACMYGGWVRVSALVCCGCVRACRYVRECVCVLWVRACV